MSNQPQMQTKKKLESIIEMIELQNILPDNFSCASDDTLDGIESFPPDSIVSSTQQQQEQPPATMSLNEIRKLKVFPSNLAVIVTLKNDDDIHRPPHLIVQQQNKLPSPE